MSNILAQMNLTAIIAVALLLALSLVSLVVLRLVRKGRARSTGDLVKIARERSAAAKETKAATKRAEAAIAEPMAPDRLSRISNRGMAVASAARPDDEDDSIDAESLPEPLLASPVEAWDEPAVPEGQGYGLPAEGAPVTAEDDEAPAREPQVGDEHLTAVAATAETKLETAARAPIDLADPHNHPTDWDGLLAVIDRLDAILAQPWHSDELALPIAERLAAARAAAGDNVAEDPEVCALSRDSAAIDLARTINNAAREQAAEIVAAVREFAYQQSFSSDDCRAVLQAMQQIEWMAVIARGDRLERRTLPLTCHDPEAPLWVADAIEDLRQAENRAAA